MSTALAVHGPVSTLRYAVEHVGLRLVPGSVVVCDEFFDFPGWEQHEYRAWQEHLARSGTRAACAASTSNDEQVAVRVLGPGTPTGD